MLVCTLCACWTSLWVAAFGKRRCLSCLVPQALVVKEFAGSAYVVFPNSTQLPHFVSAPHICFPEASGTFFYAGLRLPNRCF